MKKVETRYFGRPAREFDSGFCGECGDWAYGPVLFRKSGVVICTHCINRALDRIESGKASPADVKLIAGLNLDF
jgi:hypothetical protein